MEVSLVLLFIALLAIGYLTKRRYGLLAAGVLFGYLLSVNASQIVTSQIETQGIKLESPPLLLVTGVALVLLPSIILAFVGPIHNKTHHRWIAAFGYAVTGVFLSLLSIAQNAPSMIAMKSFFGDMIDYRSIILVIIILFALVDLFMIHRPKHRKKEK
jgi:succinate dehydrogenase hydrophobic anchor subunit